MLTASRLGPLPAELSPSAAFLVEFAMQGLLRPPAAILPDPVPTPFRCRLCHSPHTRYKLIASTPTLLTFRCRTCGAVSSFMVPSPPSPEAS